MSDTVYQIEKFKPFSLKQGQSNKSIGIFYDTSRNKTVSQKER